MKSTLLLMQLQIIDNEINRLVDRNRIIDQEMNDKSIIVEFEEKISTYKEKIDNAQRSSDEIETRIKSMKNKVEQFTASLFGGKISNSKELSNLQYEINNINNLISNCEDEQMMAWEEIENNQKIVNEHQSQFNSLLQSQNKKIEILKCEFDSNQKSIENHQVENKVIREQISQEILEVYDRLFLLKKGIAISIIEDSCCNGCGTTLTPSECQQAKIHSSIIYCPNCGRILYAN